MIRCRRIRKRLGAYYDGELQSPWLEQVSSHVEHCPACREELARLRRLSELGSAHHQVPDVSAEEWDRRWAHIREHVAQPARQHVTVAPTVPRLAWLWRRPAWTTAVAATLLLIVGLLVGFGVLPWSPPAQAGEPPCIVTLVETDVANGSVLYYHCRSTRMTVITLIPGENPNAGDEHVPHEET